VRVLIASQEAVAGFPEELIVKKEGSEPGGQTAKKLAAIDQHVHRMMQLFATQASTIAHPTTLDAFPALSCEEFLTGSLNSAMTVMRTQLLQRIHLALLRQQVRYLEIAHVQFEKGGGSPPAEVLADYSSDAAAASGDAVGAVVAASSMHMSVQMMRALRTTCPGLFGAVAHSLMKMFENSRALMTAPQLPVYRDALNELQQLAMDVATTTAGAAGAGQDSAEAAALLLSMGVSRGCIYDLVKLCKCLLTSGSQALPASALPALQRLRVHSTPQMLSVPRPQQAIDCFTVALESATAAAGMTPHTAQNLATGKSIICIYCSYCSYDVAHSSAVRNVCLLFEVLTQQYTVFVVQLVDDTQ
jgi:hypothetical protein